MCGKDFKKAISRDDTRLKNPQIAVFVIPTEFGPIVPLIKRRKYFKDNKGDPILGPDNKPAFEQWFDLPGGKADPVFDAASLKFEKARIATIKVTNKKFKGRAEDFAKIIDVEPADKAAMRETKEETGIHIEVTGSLGDMPHPMRKELQREFHAAAYCGGKLGNMVPNEHDYVVPVSPENALVLLGNRVTEEVRNFILEEGRIITEQLEGSNVVNMSLYRDNDFTQIMQSYGYTALKAA